MIDQPYSSDDYWDLTRIERLFPDIYLAHGKILDLQRAVERLQEKLREAELKLEVQRANFKAYAKQYERERRIFNVVRRAAAAMDKQ